MNFIGTLFGFSRPAKIIKSYFFKNIDMKGILNHSNWKERSKPHDFFLNLKDVVHLFIFVINKRIDRIKQ